MLIHLIAAARPNFVKVAPLYDALQWEKWADPVIIHTGQHYDLNMSDAFFQDLGLPDPDLHLGVGSGSHAEQTGWVMIAYEKMLTEHRPDLVIVVGDVNSTMAAAIAAVKLGAKVAHLEAGLRSFDRTMPEEINRVVTDALADVLWTPSPDADENLVREGISPEKIDRVGNIMIDSLDMLKTKIQKRAVYNHLGLRSGGYGLVTLHRPSNVDDSEVLAQHCRSLARIAREVPVVFPVHPRTKKNLEGYRLMPLIEDKPGMFLLEPLSYVDFMNLLFNCRFAVTDSGGVQEETTYLGIPCLTLRSNTERPITITHGTNRLCGAEELEEQVEIVLSGNGARGSDIEMWDGKTAQRVVESIKRAFRI